MASSSVSQDDIDNDFEKNSRRSRIRTARARQIITNPSSSSAAGASASSRMAVDSLGNSGGAAKELLDAAHDSGLMDASGFSATGHHPSLIPVDVGAPRIADGRGQGTENGSVADGGDHHHLHHPHHHHHQHHHDSSPKPMVRGGKGKQAGGGGGGVVGGGGVGGVGVGGAAGVGGVAGVGGGGAGNSGVTMKGHHVNKGKQQRDRRKLREKRRSTGVVHLASTESAGGSTTGEDDHTNTNTTTANNSSNDANVATAAAAAASNNSEAIIVSATSVPGGVAPGVNPGAAGPHGAGVELMMAPHLVKAQQSETMRNTLHNEYVHNNTDEQKLDSKDLRRGGANGGDVATGSPLPMMATTSSSSLEGPGNSSHHYPHHHHHHHHHLNRDHHHHHHGGHGHHHHHHHHHLHHHHHHPNSRRDKSPSDLEADDENDHDSLNQSSETGSGSNVSVCNEAVVGIAGSPENPTTTEERLFASSATGLASPTAVQVGLVVEENKRLLSMMEEKDRRINLLEHKVQQLMRDSVTITEEHSRLQNENTTLLMALSKLTMPKDNKSKN